MTRPIDETVLTAYALGELDPTEAAGVQALLEHDAEARQLVEDLRDLAALAHEALMDEPALTGEQRQAIMEQAEARDRLDVPAYTPVAKPLLAPPPTTPDEDEKVVPLRPKRRRMLWTLRITAAAATVLVSAGIATSMFVMHSPGSNIMMRTIAQGDRAASSGDAIAPSGGEPERHQRQQLLQKLESQLQPSAGEVPMGASNGVEYHSLIVPDPSATQLRSLGYDEKGLDGHAAHRRREEDGERGERFGWIGAPRDFEADAEESREGTVANPVGEEYNPISHNPYLLVNDAPLSTFSIDVDTASYANVRRFLEHHTLPPKSAVRIEELINYFDYGYAPPTGDQPFATHVEVAGCPWNPQNRLARIGIKGKVIDEGELPPSNIVFLLDVSGSMSAQNKLPLLQKAIRLLVHELDERDRVAIVVYAGASGLVLPSTSGEDPRTILKALDRLQAGGSTNGGAGIELAYQVAVDNFVEGGSNRVVLATDGDFNVGTTGQGALTDLIERKAKSGVFLSVLGFGMGNIHDGTLEQIADKGNGNYAYIDDLDEARKVLVTERGGTLVTIAKDVKIQVEFNPTQVHAYRLIGYENRTLAAQDFDDDSKDAGEIGAGHTVTALYEVVPAGTDLAVPSTPLLKYQKSNGTTQAASSGELLTVKLRYKLPDEDRSSLLSFAVTDGGTDWAYASDDFQHAAAVAAFGMMLRGSPHKGQASWNMVYELAAEGMARDVHGYRAEFATLVRRAKELTGQ